MAIVSNHYSGEAGRRYAEAKQTDPKAVGYRLNFEYFEPYLQPEHSLLDFGCGNGGMLRLMKERVREAVGLEVNPSARELAIAQGLKVYSSLEELPKQPTFDVVTSNHVLEHVRDVCSTLEGLRIAMRPGARLVVKLPFDDIHEKRQREWTRNDLDFHLQTFSVRNFANTLFESGFEVERCEAVTSCWHPRLFPLQKLGLHRTAFWAMAVLKNRRQIFAVGRVPST